MSGSPTSGDQTERLRRAFQALEQMETRFRAMERAANEPIAVIGLGCRFPGGCDNPDSYWKFLKDGRDAVTTVPVDRWDIEEYFSKDREAAGKTYVREGAYLTGIDLFDAEFFGISPREATSLDPQQRLLLEVFWEALENAGLDSRKLEGTKTGIFVGIGQNEYAQLELHAGDLNSLHPYAGSGNGFAFASGRISYVLGLRGPNMAVDTACSSSLVAVHLACQSLRRGESTLAIAGGVHLSLLPLGSVFMARTGALAADGRCKTFDAAADGFGRGEGCGAVVLKKLSQAIADNDQIWAVIPGSAVNHDGASSGLMVPSEEAQEQLLRSALADAGKKPADISYLEAHGTGTVLGDPIELGAVKSVFSDRVDPLWIGSVKTNFGHLEAASGIAGLIKVILALKNQELPRHLHFKLPNPHISWSETPFQIPTASVRWEAERRCAGVSAFGLSGTNAHVILESAPVRKSIASEKSPQLLILSASNFSALQELAARFQTFLQDAQEEQLGAICFTANTGRFVFDHRVAIVEDTKSQFAKALGLFVEGIPDSAYFSGKSHSTSNPSTKMPLRNSVSREQLLNLAQGVVKGENCDWESFYQGDNYVRVSLPTYCFQRKKYWVTPLLSRRADHLTKEEHPLLGYRLSTPLSILAFEKQFPEGKFGILGDHRFEGTPIMPAAGWIEMALAAGRIHLKQDQLSMSDGVIHRPLCLSGPIALQTHLRTEKPEQYLLEIFGKCDSTKQVSTWELHFSSRLKKATTFVESAVNPEDAKWGFFQSVDKKEVYKGFERLGLTYGAAFRTLSFISSGRDEAWAGIEGIHNLENGKYLINPAMLDGCFQSLGALFPEAEDTYLPLAIEHVEVVQCMPSSGWCHASVLEMTNSQIKADFRLYTAKGEWVASVRGFTSRKVNSKTKPKFSRLSYELKWKESSLQYSACTKGEQNWVVAGHECPLQEVITNKLKDSGCNIVKLSGLSTIHEARIVYLPPPQKSLSNKAENALAASLDLLNLLQSLPTGKSYRLCIVTCLAKWVVPADEPELNFGGLGGLAKAAANENRFLQVVEIDLGCGDEKEISLLIEELLASQDEREVAIRSGKRYLSQLERVGNKRTNDLSFALSQKETGTFETLEYGETETTLPGAKEVQIKVASAGLNFKDVLRALGMFQDEMPGCFGMECAGTVVAIGENVARFSVGDEVVAGLVPCALNGLVNATEDFVFLKPKNLSWHEASTIPIAFLTAWHGLINLAALKRGDRVLIHSAAGGVGQAAIQLALRVGAEVFATCSESKRSHIQAQGVRHIMDSRTTKFVDDIRSQTRGEGVDVVINSLRGEFINASLACLKIGGTFLEIGKRGIATQEEMRSQRPDVRYHPYDLGVLAREQPELIASIISKFKRLFEELELKPLPFVSYPKEKIQDAFRFLSQGKNIGKVIVTLESNLSGKLVSADKNYLITGGTRGLGLETARWLVENGAKQLYLLSRSGETGSLEDFRRNGVSLVVLKADVSSESDMASVFELIASSGRKLGGIVHAAGVIQDGLLQNQSSESFKNVFSAKAHGAWNLHTFSLGMELDWMVLYSSAASLFGSPGQSNYAAANSFLDSLAYFRNSRGMPTLGVNWGAWSGVGMASRMTNSDTNRMRQGGMEPLDPKEAMSELVMAMDDHRAQCAILDVEWDRIFTTFPRFSHCHYFATLRDSDNTGKQEISTAGGSLKTFAPGTGKESLRELISAELRYVLQLPEDHEIEGDRGFFEMGMDSLTAVEFRNRVQRNTALELNSSVVFDYPNIRTFSIYLERLLQSVEVENTEAILPEDSDIALLLEQELNALERDKVHG